MKTLDEVKDRCRIEDGDDGKTHWVWTGAKRDGCSVIHAPNFTKDPTGETLTAQSGTRAVWHMMHGTPIPNGWMAFSKCGVSMCVNPDHIGCGTRHALGRIIRKTRRFKGRISRILANRRNISARRKVTPAIMAEIIASKETRSELSARLGIHRDTIRKALVRKLSVPGHPFAGLMR